MCFERLKPILGVETDFEGRFGSSNDIFRYNGICIASECGFFGHPPNEGVFFAQNTFSASVAKKNRPERRFEVQSAKFAVLDDKSARFGENHSSGGRLERGSDFNGDCAAQIAVTVLDNDHCAVIEVRNALTGLFSVLYDLHAHGFAWNNDWFDCI